MPLTALRIECARSTAEHLANLIDEVFWPQPLSVSLFELHEGGPWEVEAFFSAPPDHSAITEFLTRILPDQPVPGFTLLAVEDLDWVAASLDGLKPVHAGRIFVHGAHDRDKVPAGAIAVEIDAGQAFGTGHHETTKACLLALGEITQAFRPRRVLDVGTGSGVLAIAAAKLLKTRIMATDNDPIAIEVAGDNARANDVGPMFCGNVASGARHDRVARRHGYDLILANILARPLAGMAGEFSACLAPGGHLVLSGILNTQAQYVHAAYAARGLVLRRRLVLGDWTTLIVSG